MTIGDYFKIAVGVLILLLICAVLWLWRLKDNSEASLLAAQGQITTAVAVHVEDQATITRLTTYNTANDKIMAQYVSQMSGVDIAFGKLNTAIANLRRTNADVEKYLAQPIPLPLLCVLDPGNRLCVKAPAAVTGN